MIKALRTAWATLLLVTGILSVASMVSSYMLFIAFPWGAGIAVATHSPYWIHVWIGFDKFCNAILGGDHRETVSSRLGKSTIHGHPYVFGSYWADGLVSWWLHQVDHDHVNKSIDWNVGRKRES